MTASFVREILGWCTLINIGLLLLWGIFFFFAHDWMYRLHTRWFRFSVEQFDAIHYAGMAFLKLIVIVFNLVPYLAMRIVL